MNTQSNTREDKTLWQKYAWLWFISALPALAVIASLITVVIAIKNPPSMVDDDYYEMGIAINKKIQQYSLSERLNIRADIAFDFEKKSLRLLLNKDHASMPELLMLSFTHPVDSTHDFQLPLQKNSQQEYLQQFQSIAPAHWHIQLTPLNMNIDQTWRIRGKVHLPQQGTTQLQSRAYGH